MPVRRWPRVHGHQCSGWRGVGRLVVQLRHPTDRAELVHRMSAPPSSPLSAVKSAATSAGGEKTNSVSSRAAALALFSGVLRDGQAVDTCFQKVAGTLDTRDRAFVRLLIATTLRRLGQIDAVLANFVSRKPLPPVEDTLRLGTAQLLFLDTAPHAAVDTAVQLVKRVRQQKIAGLVNAVLRKVAASGKDTIAKQDAVRLNTPDWLWQGWVKAYGEETTRLIANAHLSEAPLDLTLKDLATADTWVTALPADPLPTGSLRCVSSGLVQDRTGFSDGAWWVQDAAAALPARILLQALGDAPENAHGKTVADLCAAPGGKTLQLASAGCDVTAVDKSDHRLNRLRENIKRVGVEADAIKADVVAWKPNRIFDGVLLDAPCSATGTLRRHPDLGYLKTRKDITAFTKIQKALLKASAELVQPGGVLVYAVCSLEPDEGPAVIESILKDRSDFTHIPIQAETIGIDSSWIDGVGALRTLPCFWPARGGLDGFYVVLLKKTG